MTKIKSISDIGNLYENYVSNSSILNEKKNNKKFPKGTFLAAGEEAKEPKTFKDSGPNSIKTTNLKRGKKKKNKKNTRKTVREGINSFMKSKFDRLFENVMDDDKDLNMGMGPSSGPEGEAGDLESDTDLDIDSDLGDEGMGDEVTFTLDRETAEKLMDVLQAAIGGDSMGEDDTDLEDLEIEDDSDDLGGEDDMGFGSDDEDEEECDDDDEEEKVNYMDAVESEKLPDSAGKKLTDKNNKVPGTFGSASKGKASHEVTDEIGNSTMSDKAGHQLTKPGNNKVGNMSTNKPLFS
jgi:hypothetical protein